MALLLITTQVGCARQEAASSPAEPWTRDGQAVGMDVIESHDGERHCGWQKARFLGLSSPIHSAPAGTPGVAQYVRDPEGVLDRADLRTAFRPNAVLPPDAEPTGYQRNGTELWLADSDRHLMAYLVSEDSGRAEAWPRADPPIGCD